MMFFLPLILICLIFVPSVAYADHEKVEIPYTLSKSMSYAIDHIPNFPLNVYIFSSEKRFDNSYGFEIVDFIQKNNGQIIRTSEEENYWVIQAKISADVINQMSKMPEKVHMIKDHDAMADIDSMILCQIHNGGIISYPLKKLAKDCGLSQETIKCRTGLIAIQKNSDLNTACVKQMTALKLFDRGWGNPNFKEVRFVPDGTTETTLQQMTYSESADLNAHEKLLISRYSKQGITIMNVHYEIADRQRFGELCEGSYTTYKVKVLTSTTDAEKLKYTDRKSHMNGIDRCDRFWK